MDLDEGMSKKIVCINGSRSIKTLNLNMYLDSTEIEKIVVGGACGVDSIAKYWAKSHHIEYVEYPAQWHIYGKSAGVIRNHEMIDFADELISFWDGKSPGTLEAIEYAKKMNKKVTLHLIESYD